MSYSKNKKGFSLINIILCGLAIVLCLGLLSNLSSGGELPSGNTSSTTVPGETFAPGTRFPLTVNLTGVQILSPDGAAVEAPKYVEVGSPITITFSPLAGYEYTSGMGGISWRNASPVLVNNLDGTYTLELDDFKGEVYISIMAVPTSDPESFSFTLSFASSQITLLSERPTAVSPEDVVYLQFTKTVSNAVFGYITATNCRYNIISSSGDTMSIKVFGFTGDAKLIVGSKLQYDIAYSLVGCSADPNNPDVVYSNGSVVLDFGADVGFSLPDEVTVVNAEYEWLPAVGTLRIYSVTGNVEIYITAIEGVPDVPPVNSYFISTTQNSSLTIPSFDNPTVIEEGQSVVLTYTKANEYTFFGNITVTGADYSTEIDGDILTITISNPTNNVVVIVGNKVMYPVEYSLTGCDSASVAPTSIVAGTGKYIKFSVEDGYIFPEDITVINADYLWTSSTGEFYFDKVSGPVTIIIECISVDHPIISFSDTTDGYYLGFDVTVTSGDTVIAGYIGSRGEPDEGICVLELPFSGLWTIECSEMSFEVDVLPYSFVYIDFSLEESDDGSAIETFIIS